MENIKLKQTQINMIIQQKYLFRGTTDFSWNYHVTHHPHYFNDYKDRSTTTSIEPGYAMAYAVTRSDENYFGYQPEDRWITGPLLLAINALKYLPFIEKGKEPSEITIRHPVDYQDIILVADTFKLHQIASKLINSAAIESFLDIGFQPGDKANKSPECIMLTPPRSTYTWKR